MVIVTRLTADPDFEKNNAFRGATTQSWGLPEGLGIPDFRDGNGISISTDYYHGLLGHLAQYFVRHAGNKHVVPRRSPAQIYRGVGQRHRAQPEFQVYRKNV